MDFQEFCSAVVTAAAQALPDTTIPDIRTVLKNNDIERSALYIRSQAITCSPVVYLEPYYQEYTYGRPFDDIMKDILRYFQTPYHVPAICRFVKELTDPAPYLYIRLIHLEQNSRQLADVPYEKYLDFAAVCELSIECPEMEGTALIHYKHLAEWHMSEADLFAAAWKNTIYRRIPSLKPVDEPLYLYEEALLTLPLSDRLSDPIQEQRQSLRDTYLRWNGLMSNSACHLFALSNTRSFHGAACLLYPGILSQIARAMDADLYIIPSSIHELLLTPADHDVRTETLLTEILEEVNAEAVEPTEILGSHIYYYNKAAGRLQAASASPQEEAIQL